MRRWVRWTYKGEEGRRSMLTPELRTRWEGESKWWTYKAEEACWPQNWGQDEKVSSSGGPTGGRKVGEVCWPKGLRTRLEVSHVVGLQGGRKLREAVVGPQDWGQDQESSPCGGPAGWRALENLRDTCPCEVLSIYTVHGPIQDCTFDVTLVLYVLQVCTYSTGEYSCEVSLEYKRKGMREKI